MPPARKLANALWIFEMKGQQPPQAVHPQMRLVPQNNGPRGKRPLPTLPIGRADNGAKHPPFRRWVDDAIPLGQPQSCQFASQVFVIRPANDGNLLGAQNSPLPQQAPDDGRFPPRQKQFRPTHARGRARREDDHAKRRQSFHLGTDGWPQPPEVKHPRSLHSFHLGLILEFANGFGNVYFSSADVRWRNGGASRFGGFCHGWNPCRNAILQGMKRISVGNMASLPCQRLDAIVAFPAKH